MVEPAVARQGVLVRSQAVESGSHGVSRANTKRDKTTTSFEQVQDVLGGAAQTKMNEELEEGPRRKFKLRTDAVGKAAEVLQHSHPVNNRPGTELRKVHQNSLILQQPDQHSGSRTARWLRYFTVQHMGKVLCYAFSHLFTALVSTMRLPTPAESRDSP